MFLIVIALLSMFASEFATAEAIRGSQELRQFNSALILEDSSETSANVSIGDLDGDGDLDLVLAKGRHWPLRNRVLLNDGKGGFTKAYDLSETADRTYSAVLADVDGDGDLDAIVSNDRPDRKLVYKNDGKGQFKEAGTWGAPEWITRNAAAADLNGDGRPDAIAANRQSKSGFCLSSRSGTYRDEDCSLIETTSATSIVPADIDRDGNIDLVIPHRDGGQSAVFLGDGKGRFPRKSLLGNEASNARAAAAGDLNGDGWPDVVVGDEKLGAFVYMNDGKGGFGNRVQLGSPGLAPYSIAIGDMNNDGRQDVVIGYVGAPGSVFFNSGNGRVFSEVRFGNDRGAVYGIALGDLDGDGFLDIAAARSGAQNAVYFSGAAGR